MNLLIITDSNTTSLSSSFFSLLVNLQKKQCNIYILDKAEVTNSNFFQMNDSANFFCHKIEKDYSYQHYINYTYKTKQKSVNDFTALWIRLDPPIPNEFLYFIENYFANILMINSSKGIIKSSSKKFLLNYPELCPDMKLCRSIKDIKNFSAKFPIVIKPLNSFGGIGLCRLDNDIGYIEETKSSAKEVLKKLDTAMKNGEHFLAVKFLKNVIKGDKRVLVVNSEIVGVLNRVPAKDKWLANLTQGATSEKDVISKRDRAISAILSRDLNAIGISVFGFDILRDDNNQEVLSEINTLNVGGFKQVEEYGFSGAVDRSAVLILKYIKENSSNKK